jgi:hypothetical protein
MEQDIGRPVRAMLLDRAIMAAELAGAGVGVVEMKRRLENGTGL